MHMVLDRRYGVEYCDRIVNSPAARGKREDRISHDNLLPSSNPRPLHH